jgi:hypothetical protein
LADKLEIPQGITLEEFLAKELQASTLTVRTISKTELFIESDSIVRIHVLINDKAKQVHFDLYSPRWSRRITVQQLGGFEFMESRAEDQLLKENADAVAEDSLLALDIIRFWASKNGYEASEVAPMAEETESQKETKAASANNGPKRSRK